MNLEQGAGSREHGRGRMNAEVRGSVLWDWSILVGSLLATTSCARSAQGPTLHEQGKPVRGAGSTKGAHR
jgi:hypothetical protein